MSVLCTTSCGSVTEHVTERSNTAMEIDTPEVCLTGRERFQILDLFLHDIRNSLGIIIGYSSLLQDGILGKLDVPQDHAAGVIHDSALDIDAISATLRETFRLISDPAEIRGRDCTVEEVLVRSGIWLSHGKVAQPSHYEVLVHDSLPDVRCDPDVACHILRQLCWCLTRTLIPKESTRIEVESLDDGAEVVFRLTTNGFRAAKRNVAGIEAQIRRAPPTSEPDAVDVALGSAYDLACADGGTISLIDISPQKRGFEYRIPAASSTATIETGESHGAIPTENSYR